MPPSRISSRTSEAGQLARLGEIVELIVQQEGEPAVFQRLAANSLKTALDTLKLDGVEIARQTRSLDTAIAWSELAGSRIDEVLRFNVYSRIRPEQISRAELSRLLNRWMTAQLFTGWLRCRAQRASACLHCPRAKAARASLDPAGRGGTGSRSRAMRRNCLTNRSVELLKLISENPARMQRLADPGLQDAVLDSNDKGAAIDMLLKSGGAFQPVRYGQRLRQGARRSGGKTRLRGGLHMDTGCHGAAACSRLHHPLGASDSRAAHDDHPSRTRTGKEIGRGKR